MDAAGEVQIAPVRVASNLSLTDLGQALKAGLADFVACPIYGLFFAAIYVAAGLFLYVAVDG